MVKDLPNIDKVTLRKSKSQPECVTKNKNKTWYIRTLGVFKKEEIRGTPTRGSWRRMEDLEEGVALADFVIKDEKEAKYGNYISLRSKRKITK